jgi:hypothetical protein
MIWLWILLSAATGGAIALAIALAVGRESTERRGGLLDLTQRPDARKNARALPDPTNVETCGGRRR